MRIISGTVRGKHLSSLESYETRPTTDRVKEAVFSIIQFQIEGRKFLDLYAGSGAMGIEALSRGAKEAVFVDTNKKAIQIIKDNLENTGLTKNAKVLNLDADIFLSCEAGQFDLAYLDPPYYSGELQRVLSKLISCMNKGGIVLCEHAKEEQTPQEVDGFMKTKTYTYGKIAVSKYEYDNGRAK